MDQSSVTEVRKLSIREWTTALRFGGFAQGTGMLRCGPVNQSRFCCLGVACKAAGVPWDVEIDGGRYSETEAEAWEAVDDDAAWCEADSGEVGEIPAYRAAQMGAFGQFIFCPPPDGIVEPDDSRDELVMQQALVILNDKKLWSFEQIARWVEAQAVALGFDLDDPERQALSGGQAGGPAS